MPRSPSRRCSSWRSRLSPSTLFFSSSVRWMLPSLVEGDPVLRQRKVLAAEPEVDGVVGQHLEGHLRARPRPAQCGALARICSASDLPSIWIPPIG